jgi:hypothetical protein
MNGHGLVWCLAWCRCGFMCIQYYLSLYVFFTIICTPTSNSHHVFFFALHQYSDAPQVTEGTQLPLSTEANTNVGANGDWAEPVTTTKPSSTTTTTASSSAAAPEILDMKTAYESKMNEKEEIKEKLRVEETRMQLAAARDGMKKEEERLKEVKNKKEGPDTGAGRSSSSAPVTSSRFGAAADNVASEVAGGKWTSVSARMRGSGAASSIGGSMGSSRTAFGRGGMGGSSASGYQKQVNTNDEELFPDLATADKLIKEEEEQKQMAAAARAKVAAPSPWGSKRSTKKKEVAKEEKSEEIPAPAPVAEKKEEEKPKTKPPVAAGLKKKTKKKKKDLSTFQA